MTGLGSSCGACKFLRRKCTSECVFAPYFCYDQAASHFAAVHKVFGASNVSKLLHHLPVQTRADAAVTISYEALARIRDPIYGCVAHIFALQEQVTCFPLHSAVFHVLRCPGFFPSKERFIFGYWMSHLMHPYPIACCLKTLT